MRPSFFDVANKRIVIGSLQIAYRVVDLTEETLINLFACWTLSLSRACAGSSLKNLITKLPFQLGGHVLNDNVPLVRR